MATIQSKKIICTGNMTLDKLGIQGYTYTDLYNPKRLQELNTEFDEYYKTFSGRFCGFW